MREQPIGRRNLLSEQIAAQLFDASTAGVTSTAAVRSCFLRKVAPKLKSKALTKEIPKAQRHAVRPRLKQAFGRVEPAHRGARDPLIATLHLNDGYTQAQIAAHIGLHYATVSCIVNRQIDATNKT